VLAVNGGKPRLIGNLLRDFERSRIVARLAVVEALCNVVSVD
jgi:hypothetical protein